MPYKERKVQKLYYSIGEVAKLLDVNTSLIRFWEKEFDVVKPKKNKKGNRLFTKDDLKNLKMIYRLVKEKGFTLEGAKKKIKEDKDELERKANVLDQLKDIKVQLTDLKERLQ